MGNGGSRQPSMFPSGSMCPWSYAPTMVHAYCCKQPLHQLIEDMPRWCDHAATRLSLLPTVSALSLSDSSRPLLGAEATRSFYSQWPGS